MTVSELFRVLRSDDFVEIFQEVNDTDEQEHVFSGIVRNIPIRLVDCGVVHIYCNFMNHLIILLCG